MFPASHPAASETRRLRARICGAVQGVGFRPFIYRLASELRLNGWVNNSVEGVFLEVEGSEAALSSFSQRLEKEKPPHSFIQSVEFKSLDPIGYEGFLIRKSSVNGAKTAVVLPDMAVCDDCLREVFDPANRRFLYPFTNCTNCGPRYSIILSLPYDRPNTTMRRFAMCADCTAEYNNPADRRFHAQPNACPKCGPHLELWDAGGSQLASGSEALQGAVRAIREGRIAAVKGLGGFHLMVDAANGKAIHELRRRKHREEKPFALMVPSLQWAENICELSEAERSILNSPQCPIVIVKAKPTEYVSAFTAPENPNFGCMLPYTPLHHLMMREIGFPVIATSGNLSDEPICTDENDAVMRLGGIADVFLVHNRPICRPVDDSIVRVMAGREMIIRRARGYAPLPIPIKKKIRPMLAVGAHLKNTVAAAAGRQVFISQHIGDLETPQAFAAFSGVIDNIEGLYSLNPEAAACDKHPDYVSTRFARQSGLTCVGIQHHCAHVLSCMADNEIEPPVLGIAWDGTGLGDDGTIWGGEFLKIGESGFDRIAHFRTFPLPGGDIAVREPRRTALGLLFELFGSESFPPAGLAPIDEFRPPELELFKNMLERGFNSPMTSAVGRLFDAAASLIGLRQFAAFEGQAAIQLEFAIDALQTDESYQFKIIDSGKAAAVIDWGTAFEEIINDVDRQASPALIAARFHNMLAEAAICVARHAEIESVALSGGCFQNRYLLERIVRRLAEEGFRPYWHRRVPTNDGGISLGQILAAQMKLTATPPARKKTIKEVTLCV